jgi:hypothetical protein
MNDGSVPWPVGTTLSFVGGEDLAPSGGAPVTVPAVLPGCSVDISIEVIAPSTPGRYSSYFRLHTPATASVAASPFGHRMWIDLLVGEVTQQPDSSRAFSAIAPVGASNSALPLSPPATVFSSAPPMRWPNHMSVLQSMGFSDAGANTAALERHNGNIARAVHTLLGMSE